MTRHPVAPPAPRAVLYGFHAVRARLAQRPDTLREIYLSARRDDARSRDLAAAAAAAGQTVQMVDDDTLDRVAGTTRHQGVVAMVDASRPHVTLDDVLDAPAPGEPLLLLVLDGVTDPHNLGACLRSADAFGAHAVVVPKDRAVGVNATAAKAASGAAESVPVITVTNLARALRTMQERGLWIVGVDAGGESLHEAALDGPIALVLGAEGAGLRRLTREHCDRIVGIPMQGVVESLNVSVAAGIALFAARGARRSAARSAER